MPRAPETPLPLPATAARPLRIGFLPLNDAAPLIVAQEHGFFARHGLNVRLSREIGWATIRDKVIFGELDAAHALAGMLVSTRLGLGSQKCDCLTAFVMSTNGNTITLSERWWEQGVRDAATLRDAIIQERHARSCVFGVVHLHSTHHVQLCEWLRSANLLPQRDVRIVVVPPPQVFRNLVAGNIDGYCVGEPWTSLAVREKVGWCAGLSRDLHPGHPEKVLMVREEFATNRGDEHLALVAALTAAAELCDQPEFRPELARLLARRDYLNLPERVIAAGLVGPFELGHGNRTDASGIVVFHARGANDPTPDRAAALVQAFQRHGLIEGGSPVPRHLARELFRTDLFHQACQRHSAPRSSIAVTR